MKDSEVGELWRKLIATAYTKSITGDLIRKLVDERAKLYVTVDAVGSALRDFGIDPKEFPAHLTCAEGSQDALKSVTASEKVSEIKG